MTFEDTSMFESTSSFCLGFFGDGGGRVGDIIIVHVSGGYGEVGGALVITKEGRHGGE